MRKLSAVCLVVLLVAGLSGCPFGLNSVTLHNMGETDITCLTVTKIEPATKGFNLLPEPLAPGETFRVGDLEDGNYSFYLVWIDPHDPRYWSSDWFVQYLEGGENYDWYFNANVAR